MFYNIYFMITKFLSSEEGSLSAVEFLQRGDKVQILSVEDVRSPIEKHIDVTITEQDLFSLIGQLLRMQSEIRKGGGNG